VVIHSINLLQKEIDLVKHNKSVLVEWALGSTFTTPDTQVSQYKRVQYNVVREKNREVMVLE